MIILRKSDLTGKTNTMDLDVTEEELKKLQDLQQKNGMKTWLGGILPHLNPAEREFLCTGITREEYKELSRSQKVNLIKEDHDN